MSEELAGLDNAGLSDREVELVRSIRIDFAKLEALFDGLRTSEARLKPLPGIGMPSLTMVREIATIHALRAIKLVEGAAILIGALNHPSALPVVRALFETWVLLVYANVRFRELGIYAGDWSKFDEWARRLLQGRSSSDSPVPPIKIGVMVHDVMEAFREPLPPSSDSEGGSVDASTDPQAGEQGGPAAADSDDDDDASFLSEIYADLSDGTHPTIAGVAFHAETRPDGLGLTWNRAAVPQMRSGVLFDLSASLGLTVRAIEALMQTADELDESWRAGPGSDSRLHGSVVERLTTLVESDELPLSPEHLEVLQARARAIIEHLSNEMESSEEQNGNVGHPAPGPDT